MDALGSSSMGTEKKKNKKQHVVFMLIENFQLFCLGTSLTVRKYLRFSPILMALSLKYSSEPTRTALQTLFMFLIK